jgi:murein DD-endopeptidase MepM/ murein hydrolase activator NlpD
MSKKVLSFALLFIVILTACAPSAPAEVAMAAGESPSTPQVDVTPLPTRPNYKPGELVDYTAQSGDTLPALAARFNTTVQEIRAANPIIPPDATTMPPGLPMKIPIYFRALWGSPYQIIPDHAFVNSPTAIGFNTAAFLASQPGWLRNYREYAGDAWRTGAGIVDYVATNFSINPRLLLALLEYQSGALSDPNMPESSYVLGYRKWDHNSVYLQLVWAANTLNNGYYGWRTGHLTDFDLTDRTEYRPDPWQDASSVGLQYYFSQIMGGDEFAAAIGPNGLARVYRDFFGDPWLDSFVLMPGSLRQPELPLPFQQGQAWTYTGGPHTGWGTGEPFAGIDFAPPSQTSGCFPADSESYAIALADGMIVRSELGVVVLDLDGDGNERTGWTIFYLHLASEGRAPLGLQVKRGDPVGWPSCEGGRTTGTHIHIARKYNGEWIPADGPLAFNLDGWIAHNGSEPYLGTLTKGGLIVTACDCSDIDSLIRRESK